MTRYHLRRDMAVFTSYVVPVAAAIVVLVVGAATGGLTLALAVLFALLLLAPGTLTYRRAWRRTLTVLPDGLEVQRDAYRLRVAWEDITAVRRRRRQLILLVEELVFQNAELVALDANDRPTTVPRGLDGHAATTRLAVDLYDARWRDGPIGQQLRLRGTDLRG